MLASRLARAAPRPAATVRRLAQKGRAAPGGKKPARGSPKGAGKPADEKLPKVRARRPRMSLSKRSVAEEIDVAPVEQIMAAAVPSPVDYALSPHQRLMRAVQGPDPSARRSMAEAERERAEVTRGHVEGGGATKTMRMFPVTCSSCGGRYEYPLLPMLSYGQFVAESAGGGGLYGYFDARVPENHEAWEEVEKILLEGAGYEQAQDRGDLERLQRVISAQLDPLGGRTLSIVDGPYCPSCGSLSDKYPRYFPGGSSSKQPVPVVSFAQFRALPAEERRARVLDLWNRLKRADETAAGAAAEARR